MLFGNPQPNRTMGMNFWLVCVYTPYPTCKKTIWKHVWVTCTFRYRLRRATGFQQMCFQLFSSVSAKHHSNSSNFFSQHALKKNTLFNKLKFHSDTLRSAHVKARFFFLRPHVCPTSSRRLHATEEKEKVGTGEANGSSCLPGGT